MRIGVDGRKIPVEGDRTPHGRLRRARAMGLEGVFFRTVLEMSPTLDPGELAEIRACADDLNLYLETGLGKVNPYATAEAPELRAIGDGDIRLGFERMLTACRAIDCCELWIGTANFKAQYRGRLTYDRFRTDVTWTEQLGATQRFLLTLAPIARDLGCHLNVETHEEITTFEILRLIEAVGADVLGITFDVANVLQRGEDPLLAAHRIAPYVRQTQLRDAVLEFVETGLRVQDRPCGQGVIDFARIIQVLAEFHPELHLSIENPDVMRSIDIPIYDQLWLDGHPDMRVSEFARFVRLARTSEARFDAGEVMRPTPYAAQPYDYAAQTRFVLDSATYLRSIVNPAETAAFS